ncbi:MAG: DUF3408 domain-containing protein [Bacteroides sp.]|nr:DUF3408 domain-containing protein [Bacteroides sp.]
MAKKISAPQVDEDFMKEMIAQGFPMKRERDPEPPQDVPEPEPPIEPIPEKLKRRKEIRSEYVDRYFEKVDFTDRQLIYITRETHQKLTDIVNVIGGKQGTISGYIENIIRDHFESFKEEVNALYTSKFKKPL